MVKKINRTKAFVSFLIWTTVYFSSLGYYVADRMNLLPLSLDTITAKYNGFMSGQWSMTTQGTVLFLIGVILFLPVWYYGCVLLYKINWNFHLFYKHREKVFQRKITLPSGGGSKLSMPIKLKLQKQGSSSQLQTNASAVVIPPAPELIQRQTDVTPTHQQSNQIQMLPAVDDTIINKIEQLLNTYQVDVFKDISLNNKIIPLTASVDEVAYVIAVIHEPDEFFIINTEDGIDSDWFTTRSVISSPAKFVKEAAQTLVTMEPSSVVVPIVVIAGGQIDEYEEVENIFAEHQVILTRFNQGGPDNIQLLEDYLNLCLTKKEDGVS